MAADRSRQLSEILLTYVVWRLLDSLADYVQSTIPMFTFEWIPSSINLRSIVALVLAVIIVYVAFRVMDRLLKRFKPSSPVSSEPAPIAERPHSTGFKVRGRGRVVMRDNIAVGSDVGFDVEAREADMDRNIHIPKQKKRRFWFF